MLSSLAMQMAAMAAPGLVAAVPGTTWNPLDSNPHVTLSGDNLTMFPDEGFGNTGIRSTTSHTTGKWWVEGKPIVNVGTGEPFNPGAFGLGDAAHNLTYWVGLDGGGVGYLSGGNVYSGGGGDGTTLATYDGFSGEDLAFAADLTARKIWFYKNAVLQSPGDPTTGSGGHVIPGSGPAFIMASGQHGGCILRAQAALQVRTPPTGYAPWG